MAEYIFEITEALYNEDTGEAVVKPKFKGKLVRCIDCEHFHGDGLECRWGMFAYEDDYCSNGERRVTDETD